MAKNDGKIIFELLVTICLILNGFSKVQTKLKPENVLFFLIYTTFTSFSLAHRQLSIKYFFLQNLIEDFQI